MTTHPTHPNHYSNAVNKKTFFEAYQEISPNTELKTYKGTPFTAEAGIVKKGRHKGEKVIIFRRGNIERARVYECCWGHITNCNRTHINIYTEII